MRRLRRVVAAVLGALISVAFAASAFGAWTPPKHLTWYWQLDGTINTTRPVAAYDVDAVDVPASTVSLLHSQGKHVIGYISAGTYESWRPDASSFPSVVKGRNVDGWAGEKWLDIRRIDVLEPIMRARMQRAQAKGFDAIEPDNVDGYTNSTGFPLTGAQQSAYNQMLARTAHGLGLAVFLKNDVDQASALQPYFDGAINEECARYSECGSLNAFLTASKPVLESAYGAFNSTWCSRANSAGRMLAFFNLALDGRRFLPCWVERAR